MNCPTPPPFGEVLPYSCDPTVTFLAYSIPVLALCVTLCVWAAVLLYRERAHQRRVRDETAEAIAFWNEPAPHRPPSLRSVFLARRTARAVQVVVVDAAADPLLEQPPIAAPELPKPDEPTEDK